MRKGIAQAGTPVSLTPWVDPLPTPPLLNPTNIVAGAAFDPRVTAFGAPNYHELIEAEGFHKFHRDLPATKMWLYNGTFPGPTFINRLGVPTVFRRINNLTQTTLALGCPRHRCTITVDTSPQWTMAGHSTLSTRVHSGIT
jgi:hypothetical protein